MPALEIISDGSFGHGILDLQHHSYHPSPSRPGLSTACILLVGLLLAVFTFKRNNLFLFWLWLLSPGHLCPQWSLW